MFIGHFGLSLAAKKVAPKVSLGTLFISTMFVDLVWPLLLVLGVEKVAVVPGYTKMNAYDFLYYPYTHSLLMGVVWGVLVAGLYWLLRRDGRGALVVGLCILSHWFFDLIVHREDLPLAFGDYKVGLGLWNHVALEMILETLIFLGGTYIYATITRAQNKAGKWGFWSLIAFLLLFHLSMVFGPTPPDSVMTLFVSFMISMVIIIGWAYWVDRNREIAG